MRNSIIHSAKIQPVSLAYINVEDHTREDVDDLMTSISYQGLFAPPWLIEKKNGYSIISGFRRVTACRKLGLSEISAHILETNHPYLDCLRLAIAENSFQRPLNLIETSRSIYKLGSHLKNNKRLVDTASKLGLPLNLSVIKKLKNLCLLPWPIQSSILTDTISLSMAIELQTLDRDDALAFVRLFNQLKIGLNKQKQIVTVVKEIAQRERISPRIVLEEKELSEIMNNDDLDRGQKGRKIRYILRRRRFPTLVKAERRFEAHRHELKLGNDIELLPPKEFEGNNYTLKLTFTDLTHLRDLQNRLNKIIELPSFDKIFIRK